MRVESVRADLPLPDPAMLALTLCGLLLLVLYARTRRLLFLYGGAVVLALGILAKAYKLMGLTKLSEDSMRVLRANFPNSRHLKELKTSGLVAETHPEFDSRVRIYALNAGRLSDLKDWLARAEQGWSAQLAAFRTHVERRKRK